MLWDLVHGRKDILSSMLCNLFDNGATTGPTSKMGSKCFYNYTTTFCLVLNTFKNFTEKIVRFCNGHWNVFFSEVACAIR